MFDLLFADNPTSFSTFLFPLILLGLIIVYFVYSYFRRKKYNAETQNMFNNLTIGTKIKTYAGIYGEIVEIRDALDGSKVALIKTGEGDKVGYISIDLASVYSVDVKDDVQTQLPEVEETNKVEEIEKSVNNEEK